MVNSFSRECESSAHYRSFLSIHTSFAVIQRPNPLQSCPSSPTFPSQPSTMLSRLIPSSRHWFIARRTFATTSSQLNRGSSLRDSSNLTRHSNCDYDPAAVRSPVAQSVTNWPDGHHRYALWVLGLRLLMLVHSFIYLSLDFDPVVNAKIPSDPSKGVTVTSSRSLIGVDAALAYGADPSSLSPCVHAEAFYI